MNRRTVKNRFLRLYDACDPSMLQEAQDWYAEARAAAEALRAGTSLSIEQTAGIIAVVSPRIQWTKNLTVAAQIVDEYSMGLEAHQSQAGAFQVNIEKAFRVASGDMSAITGPKVRAFYANILGCEEQVTIDSWITVAARGIKWRKGEMGGGKKLAPTRTERPIIEAAIRAVAIARNTTPARAQAAVWCAVRGRA